MPVERRTMKFLVPLTVDSLGRQDLTGRAIVPFYINPQTFSIQEGKIIKETLTKGGFSIQYWGEQLAVLQVTGTTGSAGIEGINILNAIYKNEVSQFNNILLERALNQDQDFRTALEGISLGSGQALTSVSGGLTSILDDFTRNGFSGIIDGTKSVIDQVTDAALGVANANPAKVELIPSIGAFAVSMILYWQGVKYQGYFSDFKIDETAASQGNFDYQFSFKVTKKAGTRSNFMPWHRSPTDSSGAPISVSIPREGQRLEELNFLNTTQASLLSSQINQNDDSEANNTSITSVFTETQESTQNDPNSVSINRSGQIRGN